jgi:hypothetical protein
MGQKVLCKTVWIMLLETVLNNCSLFLSIGSSDSLKFAVIILTPGLFTLVPCNVLKISNKYLICPAI